jgi:hypothetical protein
LFVLPGTLLFMLSAIVYTALLIGPVRIAQVEFDVHTLFYAEAGLILGYLALILGALIRIFGMREGLLQEHLTLEKLRASPVLEVGGLTGLALIGGGLAWGVQSLIAWSEAQFGSLGSGVLLRTISLSTTLIMMGGITLLGSLIMGFLTLPTRHQRFNQN